MESSLQSQFTENELIKIAATDNAVPVLPPPMLCISPKGGRKVFIKKLNNEHWGLFCFVDGDVLYFIKPQNPQGYVSEEAARRAFKAISSTGDASDFRFIELPYAQ